MKQYILLIEDDNFFRKFYVTKLTESGFEVDLATNGHEGLEKLRSKIYDLILLDLVMPKLNGFEVLKEKLKDINMKNIPVIVFSTLSQSEDINEAKKLGANDYINKTFYNFDDLLNKIKKLLAIST